MNMKIVASLLLFGAYAGVCSDIVWSGDVVVPESADVTCTDHGYVTSISLGANSVVRFNTRTAHSFPITGSGKIIKEGDAEWTMATAIPNFAGDYEIASGVVNVSLGKVFGADDVKHKLVVRKGATLSITANKKTCAYCWRWCARKVWRIGSAGSFDDRTLFGLSVS